MSDPAGNHQIFRPDEIPLGHEPVIKNSSFSLAIEVLEEEFRCRARMAIIVATSDGKYSVWILTTPVWIH